MNADKGCKAYLHDSIAVLHETTQVQLADVKSGIGDVQQETEQEMGEVKATVDKVQLEVSVGRQMDAQVDDLRAMIEFKLSFLVSGGGGGVHVGEGQTLSSPPPRCPNFLPSESAYSMLPDVWL